MDTKLTSNLRPTLALMEVTFVALLAIGLLLVSPFVSITTARAAATMPAVGNCDQLYGKHCYAVIHWQNPVLGSISEITTEPLYSVNNGSDHISNEMWDVDGSVNCSSTIPTSWVEAGEATRRGYTGNWYMWVYCLPGLGYQENWLYQPPGGDVGNYQKYLISVDSGNYYVSMSSTTNGNLQWNGLVAGQSTVPNDIEIGLETTNNNYAVTHSQAAFFTQNQWEGYPHGGWDYQTNAGRTDQTSPPNWHWITPPSSSFPGGVGETTCC